MTTMILMAVLAVGADPTAAEKAAYKSAYERAAAGEVVVADLTYAPAVNPGESLSGRVRLWKDAEGRVRAAPAAAYQFGGCPGGTCLQQRPFQQFLPYGGSYLPYNLGGGCSNGQCPK